MGVMLRQITSSLFIFYFILGKVLICPAGEFTPFKGRVNADQINIRCDSTVASEMITVLTKGDEVEVVGELYDWYKIRLPKNSPCYVFKDMVGVLDEKNVVVSRENVNIRLRPSTSSCVLGKVNKDEVLGVLSTEGDWLKIKPVKNSFGWVNKMFVDQVVVAKGKVSRPASLAKVVELGQGEILIEGIIRPYGKVISRPARHKIIAEGYKTYLLSGDRDSLDALNYRRVKVTGKVLPTTRQKYPLVEVLKLELLD
jgi:SH3-like domain-containing protein